MVKKTLFLLFGILALSATMLAQTAIPAGTVIPVQLNSSIDAKKAKPGEVIIAKVAQDVPLQNGAKIKAGSKVIGKIVAVNAAQNSQPTSVALRFNKVEVAGQMTPMVTVLRAMASPLEVNAAKIQIAGDDGPEWANTVNQIGGADAVYREEGTVTDGLKTVGKSVYAGDWGVLIPVAAAGDCLGAFAGNNQPQALWVFSHDACGVYGDDVTIADAGRGSSAGRIVLTSPERNLKVRSGSALLLRVHDSNEQPSQGE